jgi:hypothetical protein
MKTFIAVVLAIVTATWLSPASATDERSVEQVLDALATLGDAKCSKAQQQVAEAGREASREILDAREGVRRMMCVCVPAQMKVFRSSLSPKQLAAKVSENGDVPARYLAEVVGKCGAEQFRANYADGCAERFAKTRRDSPTYCRCMFGVVAKIPDSEFFTLSIALKDYGALADEADKKGAPAPEPPPLAKQFLAHESACRVP